MGDVYDVVNTAKTKFSASRVVLSGVLRSGDVSWRRIEAVNDRLEWVAKTLGVTFVDPNSWVDDWDFSRDGLHINRRGARHLGQLYSSVCGIGSERQKTKGDRTCMAVGTSTEGISGETGIASIQALMTTDWEMAENDEPTAKPERRETEDGAEEDGSGA